MRKLLIIAAMLSTLTLVSGQTGGQGVVLAPGRIQDYYHVQFELTPENCELSVSNDERTPKFSDDNSYTFRDDGVFEVFVRRDSFPVPAPHTHREFLILGMPLTYGGERHQHPEPEVSIREKRRLFERIRQMRESGEVHIQ